MSKKDEGIINVTFTLDKPIVAWLDKKVAKADTNRSQVARRIFREMKALEDTKPQPINQRGE